MNKASPAFKEFIGVVGGGAGKTNKPDRVIKATAEKCTWHSRAGRQIKDA